MTMSTGRDTMNNALLTPDEILIHKGPEQTKNDPQSSSRGLLGVRDWTNGTPGFLMQQNLPGHEVERYGFVKLTGVRTEYS